MTYTDDARDLLERYLWEIEKQLPLLKRRELIREITSHLLDMAEEEIEGDEASKDDITAFLQNRGSPDTIARSYHQPGPLISREWYPLFRLILTVTSTVLGAVIIFRTIAAARSGDAVSAFQLIGELFGTFTSLLGVLVITFFVLQKIVPSSAVDEDEPWDASALKPLEHRKAPGRLTSVLSILLSGFFILILTVFRHRLTLCIDPTELCLTLPLIGPAFEALIPLILFRLGAGMALSGVLAFTTRWSEPLRIWELGLSTADIGIIALMLKGPPDTYFRFDLLEALEQFASVAPVLRWVYTGLLLMILVFTLLEVISSIKDMALKPASRLPV